MVVESSPQCVILRDRASRLVHPRSLIAQNWDGDWVLRMLVSKGDTEEKSCSGYPYEASLQGLICILWLMGALGEITGSLGGTVIGCLSLGAVYGIIFWATERDQKEEKADWLPGRIRLMRKYAADQTKTKELINLLELP